MFDQYHQESIRLTEQEKEYRGSRCRWIFFYRESSGFTTGNDIERL